MIKTLLSTFQETVFVYFCVFLFSTFLLSNCLGSCLDNSVYGTLRRYTQYYTTVQCFQFSLLERVSNCTLDGTRTVLHVNDIAFTRWDCKPPLMLHVSNGHRKGKIVTDPWSIAGRFISLSLPFKCLCDNAERRDSKQIVEQF